MTISLQCHCGRSYHVPDTKAGVRATCSGCRSTFMVPLETSHGLNTVCGDVIRLPPRRRKQKQKSARPQLRKSFAQDAASGASQPPEMHAFVVVVLALLLFVNGYAALQNALYVPFVMLVYPELLTVPPGVTGEMLMELDVTREEFHRQHALVGRILAGLAFSVIFQAGLTASLAGILTWRRHALYYAFAFALCLCLTDWIVMRDVTSWVSVNLPALLAIVVLLKYLRPAVWPRLMAGGG